MDALKKWMIIGFTPYQTTNLPQWMFSKKRLFKSCEWFNGIQVRVRPPKQQGLPLPSLLPLYFYCMSTTQQIFSLSFFPPVFPSSQ